MGFKWESPPPDSVFADGLKQYERDVYEASYQLALSFAPKIEVWMKAEGKWTDRTGNLRQSLYVAVERLVNEIAIYLDYGLSYGEFIEFRIFKYAGKLSVIEPALDFWGPQVFAAVKVLLS